MSTDNDVAFAGPTALARLVRERQATPRELVELCLRRIEALDPRLNAFRVTLAERALADADALRELGGPLAGVPIAVKDDLALAGETATRGTRSAAALAPATDDAGPIRRLRAAGAIPVGITNVPELMVFPWTASDANGITRNPWDPSRTPGGSSGGSAAAVAAGLVPAATGSDGGGSIRIPAACCGLVGMKATRGADGGWLGMSVSGALARTVTDSALMLDVMRDGAPGANVDAAGRSPARLRIAISRRLPPALVARVSTEQRGAWEWTAGLLESLGHAVEERDPAYGAAQIAFVQTWLRGVHEDARALGDDVPLERSTRQMAAAGGRVVPAWRRDRLLATRPRTTARIMALWKECDVLLTPTTATTAIGAEGGYGRAAPVAINLAGGFTPFTSIFNLTGQPAVSVPAGVGSDGLPLSVQLVGRPGAEETLYALAGEIEAAAPWAFRRPDVS